MRITETAELRLVETREPLTGEPLHEATKPSVLDIDAHQSTTSRSSKTAATGDAGPPPVALVTPPATTVAVVGVELLDDDQRLPDVIGGRDAGTAQLLGGIWRRSDAGVRAARAHSGRSTGIGNTRSSAEIEPRYADCPKKEKMRSM
jgi:hypothetical protein